MTPTIFRGISTRIHLMCRQCQNPICLNNSPVVYVPAFNSLGSPSLPDGQAKDNMQLRIDSTRNSFLGGVLPWWPKRDKPLEKDSRLPDRRDQLMLGHLELTQQVEWACRELYETTDPAIRVQAEKTCASICDRVDCVALSRHLLERADSCYSQFIAASSLTKFISNKERVVHAKSRLDLRDFVLSYLTTRQNLDYFVQQALVTLVCRLTKTGWFDSVEGRSECPFRDILQSAQKFIWSGQLSAVLIGVQILGTLVDEISQTTDTDFTRAIFYMRKLSLSFRDTSLFEIFRLGLEMLRRTDQGLSTLDITNAIQLQVVHSSLRLVVSCLSYDFMGTSICTGDAGGGDGDCGGSSDRATVQLPTAWRPVFLDANNVQLFFRLFLGVPQVPTAPQLRPLILSCLVHMASVRRTLFSNTERQTFLEPLVVGCMEVLRDPVRRDSIFTQSPASLHEFCRLLARLKSTFQLNELLSLPTYPEFITLIADFTTHIIQNSTDDAVNGTDTSGSSNTLHYLLLLWQELVASIPYVRTSEPTLIHAAASRVTRAFVVSRLTGVGNYSPPKSCVGGGGSQAVFANGEQTRASRRHRRRAKATNSAATGNGPSNGLSDTLNDGIDEDSGIDDDLCPLDDETTLIQQLERFSIIGRCEYAATCELLANLFDQSLAHLQSAMEELATTDLTLCAVLAAADTKDDDASAAAKLMRTMRLDEYRLVWLVYMMGALVTGRTCGGCPEADHLDGELIGRVLRLLQFEDARMQFAMQREHQQQQPRCDVARLLVGLSGGAVVRLEIALLSFLDNFRRIYIGESASRAAKMYQRLNELVGVGDEETMLRLFVAKVLSNLRYWSDCESILETTLALFGTLATTFTAMRKLLQLDDVKFMLTNNTPQTFKFLCSAGSPSPMWRYRSEFYAYLSRLQVVSMSGGGVSSCPIEDTTAFLQFMAPLTEVVNNLISNLLLSDTCSMSQEEARSNVVGLARDLCGVAFSLNTMAAFQLFLDWFYPSLFSLFGRALEAWPFDPQVTCPLFKLLTEIVQNRNDRLKFDGTLPTGFLLLAEIAKILITFGPHAIAISRQVTNENAYSHKVKLFTRYLDFLRVTLSGRFANFAIFGLVGDDSFEKTVKLSTEVLLCVTEEELRSFKKLSRAYFALVECLTTNHLVFLSSLDPSVIHQILKTITIGVESLDTAASWSACSCLDLLLTHMHRLSPAATASQLSARLQRIAPNAPSSITAGPSPPRPLFVSTTTGSTEAASGGIAFAGRHRLSTILGAGGGSSSLTIWADREEAGNANLRHHFLAGSSHTAEEFAAMSRRLMTSFIASFMNEECKNQWSISRPLLCLILINQEFFSTLQSGVISSIKPEHRSEVGGIFGKLMEDVDSSLSPKNRDKFTQNVSAFRHAITDFMKSVSKMALGDQSLQPNLDSCASFSLLDILLSVATSI